jgi:glutathione S-transferase
MKKSFAVVADALEQDPFLCGSALTMADVYLTMLMAWSPEPLTSRRLLAVSGAVAADPRIGPLWLRHGFKT